MMSSGANLVSTIIGFGMSATFIVFVCSRIICGRFRERRVGSRTIFQIDSIPDIEQPEMIGNEPEPAFVSAIPTLNFTQEAFNTIQCTQCVICLGEYKEKEVLRIIPYCGHTFHLSCIDIWLRKQSTCPVCRLTLHNVCEEKHVRPVGFTMRESLDESNVSEENEREVEVNARE
ncbi:unnamed protein product [Vicia faba]|uniref:RING-type domain-containing protein n=1 Tax=Vicia faba TaxID=3906 RepID=A0AAV1AA24_VICFA|nr:unnamed protein product [Vicia faba]